MRKRSKPDTGDSPSAGQVREAALRLLARREHSRLELSWKLEARALPRELIELALDRLERERLLSDERFTEVYMRSRSERGYGPLRIRAELQERGIAESLIDAALAGAETDWRAQARAVCQRHFGTNAPRSWNERAKRGRYLMQRGFSSEQIRYAMDERDGE